MSDTVFSIRGLSVEYPTREGSARAVDDVSLDIRKGEILGLVGESGCGKSTLGKAMLRMQDPGRIVSGELWFDGRDLMGLGAREMQQLRGNRLSMVFQDPMTSLNPVEKIVHHIVETIQAHDSNVGDAAARDRARALAGRLGILEDRIDDYPHQFSGGMRQRIMIALALALNADVIIADEPTTALDVIVEAQFLDLLRELREEFDLTILMITHNIGVVAEVADRVAVMYAGRLAELAPVVPFFGDSHHPYSRGLLESVPNIDLDEQNLRTMEGAPPSLLAPPPGCRFHPRCSQAMEVCAVEQPATAAVGDDHGAACWLYLDDPRKSPLVVKSG